jgi:hypothetical protein
MSRNLIFTVTLIIAAFSVYKHCRLPVRWRGEQAVMVVHTPMGAAELR